VTWDGMGWVGLDLNTVGKQVCDTFSHPFLSETLRKMCREEKH
jgi:hypothetical protein